MDDKFRSQTHIWRAEQLKDRTNLWRVTSQTLEWIYGLTNIQFDIQEARLAEVVQPDETHYAFEIKTNQARLTGLRHPMALVVEAIHIVITGTVNERPDTLVFDEGICDPLEITDMLRMFLVADNGGFSTVSVQVKLTRFDGGEDSLSRHFLYRNNLLHLIR